MREDLQNRMPGPQELILDDIGVSIPQVILHLCALVADHHVNILWRDKAGDQIDDIINDKPLAKGLKDLEKGYAWPLPWPGSQQDGF